ncbi:hypothetical protein BDW22DRAFT_1358575 [Trametopsis cervina]|nr:hypothetical protein BDW22DRAFT_1358575 [Trametopsis cervina]
MYKGLQIAAAAALLAYYLYTYLASCLWNPYAFVVLEHPIPTREYMAGNNVSRSVEKKVYAVETPEGEGALVRRSIGNMKLRNVTPFLMLDHFNVAEGAGFPDHPHRGQATVTYMLEGSSAHEDSAGHKGIINAGGVQWMCAGKGIMHAEMPISGPGKPEPRGLQLWIDLPKEYKMVEPSYQELDSSQVPEAFPHGTDGGVKVRVISGISHGVESPVRPLGGCWYFHMIFSKKSTIFQDLPAGWTAFIYIWKGSVSVGDETLAHETFNTLVLSADSKETGVKLTAGEDNTEFVLVAAEPLDQTIYQYGPFVMTTKEEIQKTLIDYQYAQNGFEKAHTWRSAIGGRQR